MSPPIGRVSFRLLEEKPLCVINQKRQWLWSSESCFPEENLLVKRNTLFPIFRDLQQKGNSVLLGLEVDVCTWGCVCVCVHALMWVRAYSLWKMGRGQDESNTVSPLRDLSFQCWIVTEQMKSEITIQGSYDWMNSEGCHCAGQSHVFPFQTSSPSTFCWLLFINVRLTW